MNGLFDEGAHSKLNFFIEWTKTSFEFLSESSNKSPKETLTTYLS
jgi:hypothetical protein